MSKAQPNFNLIMIKSTAKFLKAAGEHLSWLGVTLRHFVSIGPIKFSFIENKNIKGKIFNFIFTPQFVDTLLIVRRAHALIQR